MSQVDARPQTAKGTDRFPQTHRNLNYKYFFSKMHELRYCTPLID